MSPAAPSIPAFATSQLALLDSELRAELSETSTLLASHTPSALARAGLAVLNLCVSSTRTGLGGKTVLELALDGAVAGGSAVLPEHGVRVGDIVGVSEQAGASARKAEKKGKRDEGVEGVVLRVRRESVEVVLEGDESEVPGGSNGGKLWMWVAWWRARGARLSIQCADVSAESSLPTMLRIKGINTRRFGFDLGWAYVCVPG
jgi:DNA polymerase alpha-associated DNA helicase A